MLDRLVNLVRRLIRWTPPDTGERDRVRDRLDRQAARLRKVDYEVEMMRVRRWR
jgi:hypothetical protein